ncbi:MFS transporter [Streptomyces sp. NPDC059524]|uniref:MFS transporter n=1 Tax=Streptomyces sp. NPDC059524 TaxID=3346856 RepID=UPI00369C69D7
MCDSTATQDPGQVPAAPETHGSAGEATAAAPPAHPSRSVPALWLALIAAPLSMGIAGPSLVLDAVARDLDTSVAAVTWAVTAFGWGASVGTPLAAGLLRYRGTRAALTVSALLVAAGASLVMSAPVLPALIVGSASQALGAAGLTTVALQLARSPRRMGLVTASLAVTGSTAPLVGSLAGDLLSWRAALTLPLIGLLGVPAVRRRVTEGPATEHAAQMQEADRFDLTGALLLTALATALVMIPHRPAVAAVSAVIALVALALRLRSRPRGFVPADVVRRPAFLLAALPAFVLAVVNFGLVYAVSGRLADDTGWSSGAIGAAMVWPMLLGGALSWFVVAASARTGHRPIVLALLALGATAPVVTWLGSGAALLLGAQALSSVAASSGQGVFSVRAADAVPERERPAAIGLFTLCYLLGAAFGPALVTLLPTA